MGERFRFAEGQVVVITLHTPKLVGQRQRAGVVGREARVLYVGGEWGLADDPAYTVVLENGERVAVVESELRVA